MNEAVAGPRRRRWRGWLWKLPLAFVVFSIAQVLALRFIDPPFSMFMVARQLDAGNSYASIEKATGASATTIARVSKCLSYGAGGYTMALNILDDARKGK